MHGGQVMVTADEANVLRGDEETSKVVVPCTYVHRIKYAYIRIFSVVTYYTFNTYGQWCQVLGLGLGLCLYLTGF